MRGLGFFFAGSSLASPADSAAPAAALISTGSTVTSTLGGTNALAGTTDLDLHVARAKLNYKF